MSYVVTVERVEEQPAAVVHGRVDVDDLPEFLGRAFGDVLRTLATQHLHPVGPPFGRYQVDGDVFEVEAGFPCDGVPTPVGDVEPCTLPGGEVATTLHTGDYQRIGAAYQAVAEWMGEHHWQIAAAPWESYVDDPTVLEPRTIVRFPARRAS
ncbi:GyrI-like domain-containing protein [Longivirga aurantiaca]|uniref:GyrI-like domain-containing protein n=1 Tax=Longivirga aurantiaca TaxID=1837743 RepID=A0ABW1T225_9ACTN